MLLLLVFVPHDYCYVYATCAVFFCAASPIHVQPFLVLSISASGPICAHGTMELAVQSSVLTYAKCEMSDISPAWPRCSLGRQQMHACIRAVVASGSKRQPSRAMVSDAVNAICVGQGPWTLSHMADILERFRIPRLPAGRLQAIDERVYAQKFKTKSETLGHLGVRLHVGGQAAGSPVQSTESTEAPSPVEAAAEAEPEPGARNVECELRANLKALRRQCRRLKTKMSKLKKERKKFYNSSRYWEKKTHIQTKRAESAKRELADASYFVQRKRASKAQQRRPSTRGGYLIALKRNVGHAAATTMLETLGLNLTRQCVSGWETMLAANLTVQSIHRHAS